MGNTQFRSQRSYSKSRYNVKASIHIHIGICWRTELITYVLHYLFRLIWYSILFCVMIINKLFQLNQLLVIGDFKVLLFQKLYETAINFIFFHALIFSLRVLYFFDVFNDSYLNFTCYLYSFGKQPKYVHYTGILIVLFIYASYFADNNVFLSWYWRTFISMCCSGQDFYVLKFESLLIRKNRINVQSNQNNSRNNNWKISVPYKWNRSW